MWSCSPYGSVRSLTTISAEEVIRGLNGSSSLIPVRGGSEETTRGQRGVRLQGGCELMHFRAYPEDVWEMNGYPVDVAKCGCRRRERR